MGSVSVLRRHVRPRVAIALAVIAPLLTASIAAAWGREHRSLPGAAAALNLATIDAAALVSCFQGVQDDLLRNEKGNFIRTTVRAAKTRLKGCDTQALRDHLAAVDLPPAAPLADGDDRAAYEGLGGARAALSRALLEAIGTKRAMARNLATGKDGTPLVVGYRAMQADYLRGVTLLARVQLPPPENTVAP
jgi:hypothetical protein